MTLRKLIYDQLKTGSITNVYNREDGIENPSTPYVVLWQESDTPQTLSRSINNFRVAAHFEQGFIDDLDNYVRYELTDLFYGVELTDTVDDITVEVDPTEEISQPTTENDDRTISMDRLLTVPFARFK